MARIVLENVSKTYERHRGEPICALNAVNLTVEDKELMVLVGPSGSGKTTTLRLIAGLETPTAGTIAMNGAVINQLAPKDRDLAMVFQNQALYPHLTVYENMALGLRLRKVARTEISKRLKAAVEMLELTGLLDRYPRQLSGGQRQRVAVGRAVVRQPQAFLFDEPLSNLDGPMRMQLRCEITRLHDRLVATTIYVTHDQIEAMTMGHRIAVIKDGRIQQVADPLTLYQQPANLFVAGFIGLPPMNFVHGRLERTQGELYFREASQGPIQFRLLPEQSVQLADRAGKPIILGLRPEGIACMNDIQPSPSSRGMDARPEGEYASQGVHDNSFAPAMDAWLDRAELLGAETHYYLRIGLHSCVARVACGKRSSPGRTICVRLNLAKAHFFDPATTMAISRLAPATSTS
ncbi:MAG: ABC transporter ATP-binding protein [Candidatus Omnitrophica bacterium]|nr:ABC transporter ATP-binding protein [Candidatus Omnitrophota bacterium]